MEKFSKLILNFFGSLNLAFVGNFLPSSFKWCLGANIFAPMKRCRLRLRVIFMRMKIILQTRYRSYYKFAIERSEKRLCWQLGPISYFAPSQDRSHGRISNVLSRIIIKKIYVKGILTTLLPDLYIFLCPHNTFSNATLLKSCFSKFLGVIFITM